MAQLSAAEKQRHYRACHDADLEGRQKYLNKEIERWRKDREEELSEREKRARSEERGGGKEC